MLGIFKPQISIYLAFAWYLSDKLMFEQMQITGTKTYQNKYTPFNGIYAYTKVCSK